MWQGNHPSLALTAVAPRYGGKPKMDIISDLFDRNVNTDQIPRFILAEYLYDDVMNTKIVYEAQMKDKRLTDQKAYDLFYHDVLETVIEMEWNGAKFNDEAKTSVSEAIDEQLFISMQKVVDLASKFVDKATFNPDSPQQMARIMYGLEFKHGKPDDKKAEWVDKEKHQLIKAKWKGFVSKFKPHETGAQGKLEWMVNECFDKIENSLHIKPDVEIRGIWYEYWIVYHKKDRIIKEVKCFLPFDRAEIHQKTSDANGRKLFKSYIKLNYQVEGSHYYLLNSIEEIGFTTKKEGKELSIEVKNTLVTNKFSPKLFVYSDKNIFKEKSLINANSKVYTNFWEFDSGLSLTNEEQQVIEFLKNHPERYSNIFQP
jgi:hypothetical protein